MKRSTDRFLTTHTGSLPRPEDLIRMMYAKEEGVPVDAAALSQRVAWPSGGRAQAGRAGVDVVNDGEMSKPSYATYIKDRLNGFGGAGNTFGIRTWPTSPASTSACSATPDAPAARRPGAMRRSACATGRRRRTTSTI